MQGFAWERFFARWLTRVITPVRRRSFVKSARGCPCSGRPNTMGSWWMLALVIEGLVMLGDQSQARELYPLVRELVDTGERLILSLGIDKHRFKTR
jgi:hypothetical protein